MKKRTPDFENNLLRVLKGEVPERATLFEMLISKEHYEQMVGHKCEGDTLLDILRLRIEAMSSAGYDYIMAHAATVDFVTNPHECLQSQSMNSNTEIYDWESFEKFKWPDMDVQDYSHIEKIEKYLPEGMKLGIMGPCGVLENATRLVGYDNLCIMLYDEPELAEAIFNEVGSRLYRYYEKVVSAPAVGFICSNDDWGFNTQTLLSPRDLRKYIFPWHKKIVELAHKNGKPCMLHSCGYYAEIIDDIIDDMGFDARHSYEDNIVPVEKAYEDLNGRITVLGGIDINFLCTRTPQEIYTRCCEMLERTRSRGGYALGSGNSIAEYIPHESFEAMIRAAREF